MSGKTKAQEAREAIASSSNQFEEKDREALMEWQKMENHWKIAAEFVYANTALFKTENVKGDEVGKIFDQLARLIEDQKRQWISRKLADLGYPDKYEVKIDFKTGLINPVEQKVDSKVKQNNE